ncbi:MAG: transcription/translation regulatory transformer protein RfaH [Kangiellaceae bacterium]|nr:transcription/translation regulatory transformer protein RfaH [Kangiellaceae bacterium]
MDSQSGVNNPAPSSPRPSPNTFWYLASSKPKQENRAVENLSNQDIQAFCPMIKVEKLHRGNKVLVDEALFTGYIFISLSQQSPLWHKVRSSRGVRDWVRFAGKVAKLPSDLVENLLKINLASDNPIIINRFNQGEKVQILSGPFSGLSAIFEKDDGEKRSMIFVEFLGQKSRLTLPNDQIIAN